MSDQPKPSPIELSACCGATMIVEGGNEGTRWYRCTKCKNTADPQTAKPSDACPNDTNGDGDCGRKYCPHCGEKRLIRPPSSVMSAEDFLHQMFYDGNYYSKLEMTKLIHLRDEAICREARVQFETLLRASYRLNFYQYRKWESSGGLAECSHGYAFSIPCRQCDENLILKEWDKLEREQQEQGQ